jgi:hypothetical protein
MTKYLSVMAVIRVHRELCEGSARAEFRAAIDELNADPTCHGFARSIVQVSIK